MVSVTRPPSRMGDRGGPGSAFPTAAATRAAMTELTRAVPFNDADALERVLDEHGRPGRRR